MLTPAKPGSTWLQWLINAGPANTKEFLDAVFELLKDEPLGTEPTVRLDKYLAHFGPSFPALQYLNSRLSLCPQDHFTGFWRVPASRWLLAYIDELRSAADYEKSVYLIDSSSAPTLPEQLINHLAISDPEFLVKASRVRQANKAIGSQADLNAALLKALLPPSLAEPVLTLSEPLPVCDCENLCQLCFGGVSERTITGLDPAWMPDGKARACKSCQIFNVMGKQQAVTKEFVCQALLHRRVE